MLKRFTLLLSLVAFTHVGFSQDYFPETIPQAEFFLEVEDVAVIPDSSPGQPPRVSVVTHDSEGRLFVNDQRGALYLVNADSGVVTEYLDLRDYPELAIVSTFEAGFQSFAFHPDFHQEGANGYGRLYTIHSSSNTSAQPDFNPGGSTSFHTLLLEWRTETPASTSFEPANAGDPHRELIRFKQPFGNHNAGLIAFNPLADPTDADYGNLYIAMGDGGSSNDPQENGEDPSNPFGAILRIDPLGTNSTNQRYGLVAENDFAADTNPSTLAEIYCYGLRNPQRFGWDIVTGALYIADIGQNVVEEINVAVNGGHFGWDIREGSFSNEGTGATVLIDPVAEYDHQGPVANMPTSIGNRAVTTGEVIRGAGIPELEGKLVVSDFPTGLIFILDVENDPLDGGQDGFIEVPLQAESGSPVRLLSLINSARASRGLSSVSRADTRFSVNTPGALYITNKHDGIIRRAKPVNALNVRLEPAGVGGLNLVFDGILQESIDLSNWEIRRPQPVSPEAIPAASETRFFRVIRP